MKTVDFNNGSRNRHFVLQMCTENDIEFVFPTSETDKLSIKTKEIIFFEC